MKTYSDLGEMKCSIFFKLRKANQLRIAFSLKLYPKVTFYKAEKGHHLYGNHTTKHPDSFGCRVSGVPTSSFVTLLDLICALFTVLQETRSSTFTVVNTVPGKGHMQSCLKEKI